MVTQDVGKLRQVLDYWSCETCLDVYSPEQDYLCGICSRLNRDVVIKKTAVGTDEAVQVIAPEEFHMAKDLRDRLQAQEVELVEARDRLAQLQSRETELSQQLKLLQQELEEAKRQKEDAALVPFDFVGVRGDAEEPIVEFQEETDEPAPTEWEPVETGETSSEDLPAESTEATEPSTGTPTWEQVPDEEPVAEEPGAEEPSTFTPAEPMPPPMAAPSGKARRGQAADDAIARIEAEIAKIESELTQLATQEKDLAQKTGSKTAKPKASRPRRRART